jgi:acyl-CoA thioester hydrolase
LAASFRHRLRIRYSDCDPQGVLFFANHLTYYDVAITELWREAIGPYGEMTEEGIDMVVAAGEVRYLEPAPFDAEVEVSAEIVRLGTTGMTTRFRMSHEGQVLSEGELRHVFVAAGGNEKVEIPEQVRSGLAPYLIEDLAAN